MLLEGLAVGGVDLVVLLGERAVDAVHLLRHHVHPAPLVAAREAGDGAPAAHVIEHRDVLGDADRVLGGQHDAELADADALGLHRDVEVEQDGVGGELEALDVEVVLGEGDRVVAEAVGELRLLGEFLEHVLVEVVAHPGHGLLDLLARADGGQVEQAGLQHGVPPATAFVRVRGDDTRGGAERHPRARRSPASEDRAGEGGDRR